MKLLIAIIVLILVIYMIIKGNKPKGPKNPLMDPSKNCIICDGHGCIACGWTGNRLL